MNTVQRKREKDARLTNFLQIILHLSLDEMLVGIGEDILRLVLRLTLDTGSLVVGRTEGLAGTRLCFRSRLCALELQALVVVATVGAVGDLGAALALWRDGGSVLVALGLGLGLALPRSLLWGTSSRRSSSGRRSITTLDGNLEPAVALRNRA